MRALALVLAFGCGTGAPASEPVVCAPCPQCPPVPESGGSEVAPPETPEEGDPAVAAGECDASWLPPGLAADVDEAATLRLVEMVRGWIASRDLPGVDVAAGVVYAKSEDDVGADPPYPSFLGREGTLACGRSAVWLRDRARSLLQLHADPEMGDGVRCSENVCCYTALGEYDSSGTFVFDMRPDERIVLRAIAIVADNGTLGEEYVRGERGYVTSELARRSRERCRGEPAGIW
jgi:hypothetical protein